MSDVIPKELQAAFEAMQKHGNQVKAAKALGIPRPTLQGRLATLQREYNLEPGKQPSEGVQQATNEKAGTSALTVVSGTVRTLEGALETAGVDTDAWEVERWLANKWDNASKSDGGELVCVELWQVKVWLKRKSQASSESLIKGLIEDLRKAAPKLPKLPRLKKRTGQKLCAELCLFDMHFGKLSWGPECGADYDTDIASARFAEAVDQMIVRLEGKPVTQILFPVGNDLLQANNLSGTTEAGTRVDVDTRLKKAYQQAYKAVVGAVDKLMQIAPVEVIEVPGNHDPLMSFTLCHALRERYHRVKRVSVDIDPYPRKYKTFGVNLIGYTHGNEEKKDILPRLMAVEAPNQFAAAKVREWHVGHFHKKREDRYNAGDTFEGIKVRVIPTLCSADHWHAKKGYVNTTPEAELYLWDHDSGLDSFYPVRV